MITVYFQDKSGIASTKIATFVSDIIYNTCRLTLEDWAEKNNGIITETETDLTEIKLTDQKTKLKDHKEQTSFDKILDQRLPFDASGIEDNEHNYLWLRDYLSGIYYPSELKELKD